jgi:hypothetical protein
MSAAKESWWFHSGLTDDEGILREWPSNALTYCPVCHAALEPQALPTPALPVGASFAPLTGLHDRTLLRRLRHNIRVQILVRRNLILLHQVDSPVVLTTAVSVIFSTPTRLDARYSGTRPSSTVTPMRCRTIVGETVSESCTDFPFSSAGRLMKNSPSGPLMTKSHCFLPM